MCEDVEPVGSHQYVRASTPVVQQHRLWMGQALELAAQAAAHEDVPIGALVIDGQGEIIGRGFNRREQDADPTAHAEVLAIRQAAEYLGQWRLEDCTLVVTLEPCLMCAGSILLARIPRLVIGAWEEKMGAVGSQHDVLRDRRYPHSVEVFSGVLEEECGEILREFFRHHR